MKYLITRKTYDYVDKIEYVEQRLFSDIQYKDFYIRVTDDITGEMYAIPYDKIYEVEYIREA